MTPTRILLVDDHVLVREGIRALLDRLPNLTVVGEAGNGLEALALIPIHKPDVLMVDIAMAGLNGLDVSSRVAKQFPDIKVIILSMHANEEYVMQAMASGAVGYLLKDAASVELEFALKAVISGGTYLSPMVSRHVIDTYVSRVGVAATAGGLLTPRQREILRLIAQGGSTKDIAFTLNLSPKTVETHRAQLMERLDIHDVAGLVKYALRIGLIPPER